MKDNQEFIKGIYQKYEKQSQIKEKKKELTFFKIASIAAVFLILFSSLLIVNNRNQKLIQQKDENKDKIEEMGLASVGDFEHFYELLKNKKEGTEIADRASNSLDESANSSKQSTQTDATNQYTSTNVQETGVEEADIVKTDGKYIYTISRDKISIITVKNPNEMKEIATINLKEENYQPIELYIQGNRLVVIGLTNSYKTMPLTREDVLGDSSIPSYRQDKTIIQIYQLQNITKPVKEREIEISGNYVSSRMIENNLYFVANQTIYTGAITNQPIEELQEDNYKPTYRDTAVSKEEKKINYDAIQCFETIETANYLLLGGINVNKQEEVTIKTFLGAGQTVYCSNHNLYLAKTEEQYNAKTRELSEPITQILKFSLTDGKVAFKAETKIDGYVNNQFSMDEAEDGSFRIATTKGRIWQTQESTSNQLVVLDENLKEIGKLKGIAKGERIYSVRYQGNKAYVVTFEQVDPLFVIDLSNPRKPEILGELKLPGYSTYLHPYDETHLIGFGYETTTDGIRTTTIGLKMVMFDISDYENPQVMFQTEIGGKGAYSELLYNHKALMYSKEKNLIGFPMMNYTKGNQSEAQIYQIDLEKGFILQGKITYTGNDYDKRIQRILAIQDVYYTVSTKEIRAINANTFTEINKVQI